MKTDARVRYTRKVLKESLLQCMRSKPLKEITVKEVCEQAELNRATFYTHYRDCFDLLEQIENEMLDSYRVSLQSIDAMDAAAMTAAILDMIEANRDLCDLLIYHHADDALINKMLGWAHDLCIEQWQVSLKKATDEDIELLFSCLASGLLHVILTECGRHDREKIISFVSTTVHNALQPYK